MTTETQTKPQRIEDHPVHQQPHVRLFAPWLRYVDEELVYVIGRLRGSVQRNFGRLDRVPGPDAIESAVDHIANQRTEQACTVLRNECSGDPLPVVTQIDAVWLHLAQNHLMPRQKDEPKAWAKLATNAVTKAIADLVNDEIMALRDRKTDRAARLEDQRIARAKIAAKTLPKVEALMAELGAFRQIPTPPFVTEESVPQAIEALGDVQRVLTQAAEQPPTDSQ